MSRKNDLFYVASLIEYIGRATSNHRSDVVKYVGIDGIRRLFENACVNHCLSFKQVSDETVSDYGILNGTFAMVTSTGFKIPSHTEIGRVYARLVEDLESNPDRYPECLYEVLQSEISDAISDFSTSFYFAPRGEIKYYYISFKSAAHAD